MAKLSQSSRKLLGATLAVFVGLGFADLLLTWYLIRVGGGAVIESNPVANWWLASYGWIGMAAFKLGACLLVGVAAAVVGWHRPRTGELILVFACGAQSAVVMYSLLLLRLVEPVDVPPGDDVVWISTGVPGAGSRGPSPRSYRPGFLPESGMLLLLAQKPVQDELNLDGEFASRVTQLTARRRTSLEESRHLSPDAWNTRVRDLLADEHELMSALESEQSERLQQIAWQQQGPQAFGDPAVREALQLAPEQKERLHEVLEEGRKNRMLIAMRHGRSRSDLARKQAEERDRALKLVLDLLTPPQAARWQEMIGEPFPIQTLAEARPPMMGRFGPPPDWRRPGKR